MLLGRVLVTILYVCFRKHSCSVHFYLMNLVMIGQTAQCWCTDDLSEGFEVGEREFDCLASENERLTVFVCYHRAVRFLNYTRCMEKSHFGGVTFDKTCCLFIHVH